LRVPLPWPCPNDAYEAAMQAAMEPVLQGGIAHVAFGDLFLADIRTYREERMAAIGMTPVFPLWGRDTRSLASEMLSAGQRAIVVCVDPSKLDAGFAGREFDAELLAELPPEADACGEYGEFHTFAYAGPAFRRPVRIQRGEIVTRDGFVFADVLPVESVAAPA